MSEQEQIPFDLEKFKAGMKAKWGKQLIKYTYTATNGFICFEFEAGDPSYSALEHLIKAATMVSRHQHLIDAYNPDDTWQFSIKTYDKWFDIEGKPEWEENREFRIHPHNDLIKAYKKGAEIECKHKDKEWRDASSDDIRSWCEDAEYRIKPELEFTYPIYKQSKYSNVVVEFTDLTTGKVLVVGNNFYEVGHVQHIWIPHTDAAQWQDWTPPTIHCLCYNPCHVYGEMTWTPCLATKEMAIANGWTIIKEWEV